jgi:uncharacterized protein YwgA
MNLMPKLFYIIDILSQRHAPGKKTLQKIVYLLERKGIDLGLDYSIHYYGPYSSRLDSAIYSLQMQGAIEIIPDGMTQRMNTTELGVELFSDWETSFNKEQIPIIRDVINRFGDCTARHLELITTTDFVFQNLAANRQLVTDESIIQGVLTIKGEKFSENEIKEAVAELRKEKLMV